MALIPGNIKPGVATLWNKYYPTHNYDDFRRVIYNHVRPNHVVLEIGAGSGMGNQQSFFLREHVSKYVGIDIDERVLQNPNLHEGVVCCVEALPFPNNHFDVVFHSMVAEHLKNPLDALREVARVLKPQGILIFETVNRWYYAMIISRITPHWFHEFYLRKLESGRSSNDVIPTYYRFNDKKTIFLLTRSVGFEAKMFYYSNPPGYLRFSRIIFLLVVLYERTIERWSPGLRQGIIVIAKKQLSPAGERSGTS
jgi:ubiquinone/menaquinone biosynthesis C-methylase UbiE